MLNVGEITGIVVAVGAAFGWTIKVLLRIERRLTRMEERTKRKSDPENTTEFYK